MSIRILLPLLLFVQQTTTAQNNSGLLVTFERVADSDSIWVSLRQPVPNRGTLMIVAKAQEAGVSDTMYYPVIDTLDDFLLTVPENFLNNHISLTGYYYPGLRKVTGKLNNRKTSNALLMFLFGKDMANYNNIIEVSEDKNFALPKLVFENKATVFFNFVGTKRKPDISIEQLPKPGDYDSLMATTFNFGANLFTSKEYDSLMLIGKLPANAVRVEGKGKELQQIIITGQRKTKLEKYKEQFSSGLFESIMDREYNFLDNDEILTYPDCINYLMTRMAGLTLGTDRLTGERALFWRKEKVKAYFIDEIEVDFNQMQMLDVTTIAYMKFLPTLLAGSMNPGNGGAVVAYTRKGEFVREGSFQNNYIFSIKGYTPSEYMLFSGK